MIKLGLIDIAALIGHDLPGWKFWIKHEDGGHCAHLFAPEGGPKTWAWADTAVAAFSKAYMMALEQTEPAVTKPT